MFTYRFSLILGLTMIFSFSGYAREKKIGICGDTQVSEQNKTACLMAKQLEAEKQVKDTAKELRRLATPAERKAFGIVEKNRKQLERLAQQQNEAFAHAHVYGCDTNPPEISPEATYVNLGWFTPQYATVHVINLEITPVNIAVNDGHDTIVKNLCGHGSMDIFRQYRPFVDPNYITFSYIASGVLPDGSFGTQIGPSLSLSGQGTQNNQAVTWQIQLQKQVPYH